MQKEIESAVSVIDTLGLEVVLVLSLLLAGGWAIKFLMGKSIELANKFLERIEKNMEELHEEVKTLDDKIIGQFNRRRGEDSEIWAMVDKNVDKILNEQQAIIIKLVDRIRMLQEDMIRFDTMFRVKNELEIDYDRLGESDRIDKN